MRADIPKTYKIDDYLYSKVEGLKTFLEEENFNNFFEYNNLIALYGKWGSGKSSVLKTLENKIDENRYKVLFFETWKYERDVNLPLSLYEFILDSTLKDIVEKEKRTEKKIEILKENFWKALNIFSKTVDVKVANISLSDILNFIEEIKDTKGNKKERKERISEYSSIENFIESFKKYIKDFNEKTKKKILVLVDDLDRCDENIISLISALKLMFSLENIIFICAIDKSAVIKTLEGKYNDKEKAEKYLEKIFSINFNIINQLEAKDFFDEKDEIFNLKFKSFIGLNETNPRTINRVLNKYEFLLKVINLDERIKENKEKFKFSNEKNIVRLCEIYLFLKLILLEIKKIELGKYFSNKYNKNGMIKIKNKEIYIESSDIEQLAKSAKTKESEEMILSEFFRSIDKISVMKEDFKYQEGINTSVKYICDKEFKKYY